MSALALSSNVNKGDHGPQPVVKGEKNLFSLSTVHDNTANSRERHD